MSRSWKLMTVRGIDIRLHATFPLILIWAALQFGALTGNLAGAIFGVAAISLLFVLVTLHELGHSVVAQGYGVPVQQIVLTPIGGVAQLSYIPDKPVQELLIALAGPAVNFALALGMGAVAFGLGLNLGRPLAVLSGVGIGAFSLATLFAYIFYSNVVLGLFNLLPAFPMDGGRVLRALLAMRLEYVRATDIAANVGRALAVLMGLFGLLTGSFFQMLIALFIYMGATQEAAVARLRGALRGRTVQQVYSTAIYRLTPQQTLQQAANLMVYSGQTTFPVFESETLVGILPQRQLLAAVRERGPLASVGQVMGSPVTPVAPDEGLYKVQERLDAEQLDALPVASGGRFLGLITRRQIVELVRLLQATPRAAMRPTI